MGISFDKQSIERIVRSVLDSERRRRNDATPPKYGPRDVPLFGIVRGRAVGDVTADTETFEIENVEPLGQGAAFPDDPLTIVNVPGLSFTGRRNGDPNTGDRVYAIFNYATYTGTGDGIGTGTGTGDGNWEPLAISGSEASVTNSACMITSSISAVSEISGTDFTATPGRSEVDPDFRAGGVVLLKLNTSYRWVPQYEEDPVGTGTGEPETIVKRRTGINCSLTTIRASEAHPVIGIGALTTLSDSGVGTGDAGTGEFNNSALSQVFIISNIMDFRSIPGFHITGTGTGTAESDDILIPYFPTGATAVVLDSNECADDVGTGT